MKLNTILTELVDIADALDKRKYTDIGADIDAAIFILSSEDSQPLNKSLASLVKEQFVTLNEVDASVDELEDLAVVSASSLHVLLNEVLGLEPKLTVAILSSLVQSIKSVLEPDNVVSRESLCNSAELLAEAERKLVLNNSKGIGYRVGVLRAALEKHNG